jgi:hypothetical protein
LYDVTAKFQSAEKDSDPVEPFTVVNQDLKNVEQDPEYWEKAMDTKKKAKSDWKKGALLFLVAGPKASLIMGPIMIKKMLARFDIILTKQMLGWFAFNMAIAFGIWMLYKNQ